jgi:hypothetical protein
MRKAIERTERTFAAFGKALILTSEQLGKHFAGFGSTATSPNIQAAAAQEALRGLGQARSAEFTPIPRSERFGRAKMPPVDKEGDKD